ncbi:MAG: hypothetical protein R2684_17145 [Pyrinomonadaceae bacterium]
MKIKTQELTTDLIPLKRRAFVVELLPEGMETKDPHLQIFDNHIENTGLRLRKTRRPETDEYWFHMESKRVGSEGNAYSRLELTREEYNGFSMFRGREIRKNRYFCEDADGREWYFDMYLGPLMGLYIAMLESGIEDIDLETLPFVVVAEVTKDEYFQGSKLVGESIDDVRAHLQGESVAARS